MKPYAYYETTSVSMPNKDDYMTIYYYKKGVMVAMKRQFETNFEPPENCVEEKVLDEISYNAHRKHYSEETIRLRNEFKHDLISKYNMTHHLKANQLFDKAWDYGESDGLWEVEDYFMSLIELFKDDETNDDNSLFSLMTN